MAKKTTITQGSIKVVGKTTRNGREVWRVSATNGRISEITTKASSQRAITEAATLYGRALQRLAHR